MDELFKELNPLVVKHDPRAVEGRVYIYCVGRQLPDVEIEKARAAFDCSMFEEDDDKVQFGGMATAEDAIDFIEDKAITWLDLPDTQVLIQWYALDDQGERTGKPMAVVIPQQEWTDIRS